MRILGLDVGERRIGVAVSDPLGLTAQGLAVWTRRREEEDLAYLHKLIREYEVERVVVGLPVRTDGQEGPEAAGVRAFGQRLAAATGVPVEWWDERFTTAAAQRALLAADLSRRRRRAVVDQVAAALMLQAYLERQRRGTTRRPDP